MKKLLILVVLALLLVMVLGGILLVKRSILPEVVTLNSPDYYQEKVISGHLENIRVVDGEYMADFKVGRGLFSATLPVYLTEDYGNVSFGQVSTVPSSPGTLQELWGPEKVASLVEKTINPLRVHIYIFDTDSDFEAFMTDIAGCVGNNPSCSRYRKLFAMQEDVGILLRDIEDRNWWEYFYLAKISKPVIPAWRLSQLTDKEIEYKPKFIYGN